MNKLIAEFLVNFLQKKTFFLYVFLVNFSYLKHCIIPIDTNLPTNIVLFFMVREMIRQTVNIIEKLPKQ